MISNKHLEDTKDEIQMCLSCKRPFCINCLGPALKEQKDAGENPCVMFMDKIEKYGRDSIFARCAIYSYWKLGYGDSFIAKKINSTRYLVSIERQKMGLPGLAAGYSKNNKSEFAESFLSQNPEIFKKWEAVYELLNSESFSFKELNAAYGTSYNVSDTATEFVDRGLYRKNRLTDEEKTILNVSVYKLWLFGYTDFEISDELRIRRYRVQKVRSDLNIPGWDNTGKRINDRRDMAKNYVKEHETDFKDLNKLLEFYEGEE